MRATRISRHLFFWMGRVLLLIAGLLLGRCSSVYAGARVSTAALSASPDEADGEKVRCGSLSYCQFEDEADEGWWGPTYN